MTTERWKAWLIIETGSNHDFVFRTTKQRVQLAASALIRDVGKTWVSAALDERSRDRHDAVVLASGRAEVLLRDEDEGRQVVEDVTREAIRSGIDLDVWGVVRPIGTAADGLRERLSEALQETWKAYHRARADRTPPLVRFPASPFTARCAFTGAPAARYVSPAAEAMSESTTRLQPASAPVAELWRRAPAARAALSKQMQKGATDEAKKVLDRALMSEKALNTGEDLENNGWYGVLHMDGNGVGSLFQNLAKGFRDDEGFIEALRRTADELDRVTWQALREAVLEIATKPEDGAMVAGDTGAARSVPEGWVLPIIVGGDDVVLVADGRHALRLAATLAQRFGELANAEDGWLAQALAKVHGMDRDEHDRCDETTHPGLPCRLSLGGGLVFVKPHHPFSHAVALAEDELVRNAKSLTRDAAALDVHVVFESGVRTVAAVRAEKEHSGFSPVLGPFRLDAPSDSSAPVSEEAAQADTDPRRWTHVEQLIKAIRDAKTAGSAQSAQPTQPPGNDSETTGDDVTITSGLLHRLREALARPATDIGPAEYEAGVNRALRHVRLHLERRGSGLFTLLAKDLRLDDGEFRIARFSEGHAPALLTALELADVIHGTRDARDRRTEGSAA
ncbi:MAG: hypothetical protein FWD18_08920 [Micrococcales bacterium]|nr:hypothetical protein [Micrococcales bacterium]